MLNGVNLNYVIVLLVTGSLLLAAVYHTVLFSYRRTALLGSYSAYLWSTLAYCAFRSVYIFDSGEAVRFLNLDEVLQMVAFAVYIRFAAVALNLHPVNEKYAWRFVRLTPYVIGAYLLLNTVLVNLAGGNTAYVAAKMTVRFYLLFMGFLMLVAVVRKRESVFYRYLAAGAISMIFCGLVSSVLNLLAATHGLAVGAISWLMFGFFLDVVFFSSAIGYRIRQEHQEREASLQALLQKEAELQQKELEKLKAVYETREEERLRIARDLHDDMGSTLSSVDIYSNVASAYLTTDPQKARDYLQKIQTNTRQMMENTHDLIWSLQTAYGETESLYKRMARTAVEMLSSANIVPQILIDADALPPLLLPAQKACWLIFKEAVNNACKYSRATACTVKVDAADGSLFLTVSDNGVGFAEAKEGNGLRNLAQRTAALGGACTVQGAPQRGTTVTAVLPLQNILAG